jgi:hypothetical protein
MIERSVKDKFKIYDLQVFFKNSIRGQNFIMPEKAGDIRELSVNSSNRTIGQWKIHFIGTTMVLYRCNVISDREKTGLIRERIPPG